MLVLMRKNREISGYLNYLQSAWFIRFFIPVKTDVNISKIEAAKGFSAGLAPRLSRSLKNTPQLLRHKLR